VLPATRGRGDRKMMSMKKRYQDAVKYLKHNEIRQIELAIMRAYHALMIVQKWGSTPDKIVSKLNKEE
jgi:hypothetical protein